MSDSLALDAYRKRLTSNGATNVSEALRNDARMIKNACWEQTSTMFHCKLYKHKKGTYGTEYEWIADEDVRFTRVENQNVKSNEIDFKIEFRPSVRYDIGTYIDIPDEDTGIMQRWLICHKDNEKPFTRYHVLRCNFLFKWVYENHVYQSYGVTRGVNSYSSGLKKAEHFSYLSDLNGLWIPTDDVSCTMEFDTRLIIGDPNRKKPIVWKISSIEECNPEGISKFTMIQDFYNAQTDYDEKYGFIADIRKDVIIDIEPQKADEELDYDRHIVNCEIIGECAYKTSDGKIAFADIDNFNVKIGKTYRFRARYTNAEGNAVNLIPTEWSIEGLDVGKDLVNYNQNDERGYITFKVNKDYYLGNTRFIIKCVYDNGIYGKDSILVEHSIELEVLA